MSEQRLTEGTTEFFTDSEKHISAEMAVFYNPVMKRNRDLTLAVLLAMQEERDQKQKGIRIGLPMEASGIRAARILNELVNPGHFTPRFLALNDLSETAIQFAKRNIALNDKKGTNVSYSVDDASIFLLRSVGFDYVDIDPFGTPNPFLDAAVQNIVRGGILAVTATDTSALAGTYPAATARKYWATPSRTWVMHEIGLRILIRKVQLVAAQYEKALVPVLSLATDHYYRIFFRCLRSQTDVKNIVKQHKQVRVCNHCLQITVANDTICSCSKEAAIVGPLWRGMLHDRTFIAVMRKKLSKLDEKTAKELDALLAIIEDESRIDSVGFLDLHELASRYKIPAPRTNDVIAMLGPHACRTHINGAGIKTDLSVKEVVKRLWDKK